MKNKIALVTGVTREMGLGYGIVKGLKKMGARSVDEAFLDILWAAKFNKKLPSGRFFGDGKEING